jgi:7-cyano-7-deazaguanine tRNA-ribosyltransferase
MPESLTINNITCQLPMFLPVFERGNEYVTMNELRQTFQIQGIITNGFFLYKDRQTKAQVLEEGVKTFYDFPGLVVTDSGAFQGFTRPLHLKNTTIIKFQQDIGADVVSPLDVVTTPGESKTACQKKLNATLRRIAEGLPLMNRSILVGVQQGGRFPDLRRNAINQLIDMKCRYIALGSLVPFFNKQHDLSLVGRIIRDARALTPKNIPIHLYGAGDPVELPFYAVLGCDIFDSSSFVHYARKGWYMTPYGAIPYHSSRREPQNCDCPFCNDSSCPVTMTEHNLAKHNLWTILNTVRKIRRLKNTNQLNDHLQQILARHAEWFPESLLVPSWQELQN